MKKHVLILGAGFGGLELATRLSETAADAVRVTIHPDNSITVIVATLLVLLAGVAGLLLGYRLPWLPHTSREGKRRPTEPPAGTTSRKPPVSATTHRQPEAIASSATRPNGS